MIVVSDTGPVNYLVQIDQIELLRAFYGRVLLPPAVVDELGREATPVVVRQWLASAPEWIEVREPSVILAPPFSGLGRGELEAASLAHELQALLLVDDLDARRFADAYGTSYTGTLGILVRAHEEGLLEIRAAVNRLVQTSYYASSALLRRVIDMAEGSRGGS